MTKSAAFRRLSKSSGIAIGPLIFVLALLGILAVAITSGSHIMNTSTTTEAANVQAAAIIEQQRLVYNGVSLLMGRGCDATQISFETDALTDYTNALAPTDRSCHIFDPRGAGVIYMQPPKQALDSSHSADPNYGNYFFTALPSINKLGNYTTSYALVMTLPYVKEAVAKKMNEKLGIEGDPANNTVCNLVYTTGQKFVGAYGASSCGATSTYGKQGAADTNVAGQMGGCVYRSDLSGSGYANFECFAALHFQ